MGNISKAKHYLERYYETDNSDEQVIILEEAILEIENLIYKIKEDKS